MNDPANEQTSQVLVHCMATVNLPLDNPSFLRLPSVSSLEKAPFNASPKMFSCVVDGAIDVDGVIIGENAAT